MSPAAALLPNWAPITQKPAKATIDASASGESPGRPTQTMAGAANSSSVPITRKPIRSSSRLIASPPKMAPN